MNPLISLAGDIASTAISGMFSDKQARQARKFAQAQALQNQELQRQNWETALREGSARQVAGMKAAGLNPAMMQGGAPATPPLTSSPGTVANPNPVSVPSFGNSLLQGQSVLNDTKRAKGEVERMTIENHFLPEQISAGIKETLSTAGVNEKSIEEKAAHIQNMAIEGGVLMQNMAFLAEQTTASQWNRIISLGRFQMDAALAAADIDVKGATADQLRQMTPALVFQAYAQGNLNEALFKVAGILGDPQKAANLIHSYIKAIQDHLPNIVKEVVGAGSSLWDDFEPFYKKGKRFLYRLLTGDKSAHFDWSQEHGENHPRPPMQWRPRWTE